MAFLPMVHLIISVFMALLLWRTVDFMTAVSLAAGAGVSLFNLTVVVLVWPRILAKKLVALSIGVIVFKFAILGWILYEVVSGNLFHLGWFAVGMGLVVPSVLLTSFKPQGLRGG